ncbi:MAG: 2-C-methyl-D-erythritol 4-phosphate cytidylyltransferase [Lachnoclostridium sp.]|jgi:2-C-methyl-D-erythritol 4-phosphate cytidylyltransferase|nr:2-C-methyl-D-erythritol 4-phosphate cytidylyltransferase [Lachnoclostridium sp.]
MIFAAIMAGGTGSRMKISDKPKQFLEIGGKPIVIHTLEKFMSVDEIDEIYIGVHPEWTEYMRDLIRNYVESGQEKLHVVPGGTDRNLTLMNVIDQIEGDSGESEEHFILTHDAVRPFVTEHIIVENIKTVRRYDACGTAIAAIDTIVASFDGKVINEVPERKMMYQQQTPQSFRMSLLRKLFCALSEEEKEQLTDACKIFVISGVPVRIVEGDVKNMKITTPGDYQTAEKYMESGG